MDALQPILRNAFVILFGVYGLFWLAITILAALALVKARIRRPRH